MNKQTKIAMLLLIVIGCAFVYVLTVGGDKAGQSGTANQGQQQALVSEQATQPTAQQSSGMAQTEPATPAPAAATPAAGAYVDYQSGIVAQTSGTKLLFFHAPWCSQCRALESDIKARGVPAGVTIIKVDYDGNQSLRQQYGVTLQTTVVRIDDAGAAIEKFVAYDDPTLAAVTQNLL